MKNLRTSMLDARRAPLLVVPFLVGCAASMQEKAAAPQRPAYSATGVTVFVEPEANDSGCDITASADLRGRLVAHGFSIIQDKSLPHALDMRVTPTNCVIKDVEIARNGVVIDAVESKWGYQDANEVVTIITRSERIAAALRAPAPTSSPSTAATKRRLGKPTSLLMLPLKPVSGVSQSTLELISGYMLGRLDAVEGLRTVGRDDIEASLGVDKQRQALGCDALACMAEIGGALGVELVMYGQIGRVGSKYSVNVSVVRANDARVIARTAAMTEPTEDAVVAQLDLLINELVDKVDTRN